MSILFAGDTHGNTMHVQYLFKTAKELGANNIVQVGDFGYWPHVDWGKKFLKSVTNYVYKFGIDFHWIDGNHENHDLIQWANRDYPMLHYIHRGEVVTIDGVAIMGYGGAFSVDKNRRIVGQSYWPQETIQWSHLLELLDSIDILSPKVDILVTHDVPAGIDLAEAYFKETFRATEFNRKCVRMLMDKVHPKVMFCGHYHTRKDFVLEGVPVHVLDRDNTRKRSWYLYATESPLGVAESDADGSSGTSVPSDNLRPLERKSDLALYEEAQVRGREV